MAKPAALKVMYLKKLLRVLLPSCLLLKFMAVHPFVGVVLNERLQRELT